MRWLTYSPNLTGCYLASTIGSDKDGNISPSTDNLFTHSTHDRRPKVISYIISHEINRTGSVVYHDFIIDNITSITRQNFYKIMRPNQVCFYPKSPTEIQLYKYDYSYTKRADSDEMYESIPHLRYFEDGWKSDDVGETDYGEGIQSMYVLVNPDHCADENYLVPRGSDYNHLLSTFGTGKTFENGSYDMLCNDGILRCLEYL